MNKNILTGNPLAFLVVLALASSCAGPTTPLGAIWSLTPAAAKQKKILTDALQTRAFNDSRSKTHPETPPPPAPTSTAQRVASNLSQAPTPGEQRAPAQAKTSPHISFWPKHQNLHSKSPLRISITDPTTDSIQGYRVIIRYNGADVTSTFLLRATVEQDLGEKSLLIENPSVRLPANLDHEIEVFYLSPSGSVTYAAYESPSCYAFRPRPVHRLGEFDENSRILSSIQKIAIHGGLNPSFFAALIAQESGFNPKVVSTSRALGLTQITSSAEDDLIAKYSQWPRYTGAGDLSVPMLKALILAGYINASNEWRLDPEKSIQGGVDYAILLAERWSTPERLARIKELFTNPEEAHTELVLASYHSGYNRVLSAFERMGKHWMYSRELREARKYVRRIESYCDYFSEEKPDEA